jgi:hypothetical protein
MKKYLFILSVILASCQDSKLPVTSSADPVIGHYGRTEFNQNKELVLISTASYAEFTFTGDSCIVYLKNSAPSKEDHNYVSIELDSQYVHRLKVDGDTAKPYTIKATTDGEHLLRIYKASESVNGTVVLINVQAKQVKTTGHPARKKIEFIGDSHTASYGCDTTEVRCWKGTWYDQHNGYYSYGPIVARALNADFLVSAVSGIGMYRNWNTPHPVMPEVYENMNLTTDSTQHWDFNQYTPDLVSICLGTNDFSENDGEKRREPFDSSHYIKNYVDFIGTLYKHYPTSQIVLLTSCVVSGDNAKLLLSCLESVRDKCGILYPGKPAIQVFPLNIISPKGCDYHPSISEQQDIAAQLEPFFRKLLEK